MLHGMTGGRLSASASLQGFHDEHRVSRGWFEAAACAGGLVQRGKVSGAAVIEKEEKVQKQRQVVLMLHGFTQSSVLFEKRCANFARKVLKPLGLTPCYIDAPHACPALYAADRGQHQDQQLAWFVPGEMEAETRPVSSRRWCGWEEALADIEAAADEEVVGVVGFSQGAMMAALLLARRAAARKQLRFGVLLCSGDVNDPAAQALLKGGSAAQPLNALCTGGTADPLAPPKHCRTLARRLAGGAAGGCVESMGGGGAAEACGGGVWFREVGGGHGIPANKEFAALKAFIKEAVA